MVLVLVGLQQPIAIVHHAALVAREAQFGVVKARVCTQSVRLGEYLGAVLTLEPNGCDLAIRAALSFDQTFLAVMRPYVWMVLEVILPVFTVLESGNANGAAAQFVRSVGGQGRRWGRLFRLRRNG